jgi:hypothetical protein
LYLVDEAGWRPVFSDSQRHRSDPASRDLVERHRQERARIPFASEQTVGASISAGKISAFMRAKSSAPALHSLRQHGLEGVVAAPEMVVERRRGVKPNQAEEKEPDHLVHLQELLRERAVLADQRR